MIDLHMWLLDKCYSGAFERMVERDMAALAAATGTAKTPKAVECEASQSGHEVATPTPITLNQGPTHER